MKFSSKLNIHHSYEVVSLVLLASDLNGSDCDTSYNNGNEQAESQS